MKQATPPTLAAAPCSRKPAQPSSRASSPHGNRRTGRDAGRRPQRRAARRAAPGRPAFRVDGPEHGAGLSVLYGGARRHRGLSPWRLPGRRGAEHAAGRPGDRGERTRGQSADDRRSRPAKRSAAARCPLHPVRQHGARTAAISRGRSAHGQCEELCRTAGAHEPGFSAHDAHLLLRSRRCRLQ
jgi:hypothetical protein